MKKIVPLSALLVLCAAAVHCAAQGSPPVERPISVNGVFPNLTVFAPGAGSDSEAGIGALAPWADKLWAVGYVAHVRGEGLGLYEISEDMTMKKHPASVTGTWREYAKMAVRPPSRYAHHEFPDGFSAHWVRITAVEECTATAYFFYN